MPWKAVRARLGDDVHLTGGTSELGRVDAGLDLEFLERIDRRQEDIGVEIDVGVVHAVQRVVVELAPLARDRELLVGARAALPIAGLTGTANSALTFGLRAISDRKFRPFSGSSTMRRFSMTVPTVAFSVVISGETPVTSTVSDSVPIRAEVHAHGLLHLQFNLRVAVLNPWSSHLTV